jgi:hypothetical protein
LDAWILKSKEELYVMELNGYGKINFRGSKFEPEPAGFDLVIASIEY